MAKPIIVAGVRLYRPSELPKPAPSPVSATKKHIILQRAGASSPYEIPVAEANTAEKVLWWLGHLATKAWFTNQHLAGLVANAKARGIPVG